MTISRAEIQTKVNELLLIEDVNLEEEMSKWLDTVTDDQIEKKQIMNDLESYK